jgi:hypothetical protein
MPKRSNHIKNIQSMYKIIRKTLLNIKDALVNVLAYATERVVRIKFRAAMIHPNLVSFPIVTITFLLTIRLYQLWDL